MRDTNAWYSTEPPPPGGAPESPGRHPQSRFTNRNQHMTAARRLKTLNMSDTKPQESVPAAPRPEVRGARASPTRFTRIPLTVDAQRQNAATAKRASNTFSVLSSVTKNPTCQTYIQKIHCSVFCVQFSEIASLDMGDARSRRENPKSCLVCMENCLLKSSSSPHVLPTSARKLQHPALT